MSAIEAPSRPILEHHYDDLEQQHDSSLLGMWSFLATEVLFFGGLFAAYTVYRTIFPAGFIAASRRLSVFWGGVNTAVLLTSSLAMAFAVRSAQLRRRLETVGYLAATMALGCVFLGIKFHEWSVDYHEHLVPGRYFHFDGPEPEHAQLFFILYFLMTGLHAFHMIVGVAIVGIVATLAYRDWFSGGGETQIEVTGLYWHFVDLVWVFLYPLLYLIEVHR